MGPPVTYTNIAGRCGDVAAADDEGVDTTWRLHLLREVVV